MVAILILTIGVLGLASTSTVVSRLIGGAAQQTIAANVASNRFEQLRSVQCTTIKAGTTSTRGIREKWSVTQLDARTWAVVDSLFWTAGGGLRRRQVVRSYVRC